MGSRGLLKKAGDIRVRDHRLKLALRLRSKEDAIKFVHDEGLVSFLGGNELPSFISASLGRPWKPSKKGFAGWMDWWSVKLSGQTIARVSRDLEGRKDILATRLFRRTKTLVSNKIWPILDPIIKYHEELVKKERILSKLEQEILRTIEREGSIRTDRLRKTLKLKAKENNSRFHRALVNLESYSLIVGVEDPRPETHLHAKVWQTWKARTKRPGKDRDLNYQKALAGLLEKTVQACVVAPENQITKWYPWGKDMKTLTGDLLDEGRLIREGDLLVSPLVTRQ